MRYFSLLFLLPFICLGQQVNIGGTPAGIAVGSGPTSKGENIHRVGVEAPNPADLELIHLRAHPLSEGDGALAEGARGATTPKIGFVTTTSLSTGTSVRSVESWGTAYEGSLNDLHNLGDIFIVNDVSGKIDTDDGYCFKNDRCYLFGDNVTYYGHLGPDIYFDNVFPEIGVPLASESSCGGFYASGVSHNIYFGIQVYHSNAEVGTSGAGQYGTLAGRISNSNNTVIAFSEFNYGGDQNFDIDGKQRVANEPYADFGKITFEYNISANGFGTAGLAGFVGGSTAVYSLEDMIGGITAHKNLSFSNSHRIPFNMRGSSNAGNTDYAHQSGNHNFYNNYSYNHYGVRMMYISNATNYPFIKNNVYDWRGGLSDSFDEGIIFKFDEVIDDHLFGNIYVDGNVIIGEAENTDEETWFTFFATDNGHTAGDVLPSGEFTATETPPPNGYWFIPTSGADSLDVQTEVHALAGSQWGTDTDGHRTSAINTQVEDVLADILAQTQTGVPSGLEADDSSTAIIPALKLTALYTDSSNDTDNNTIPDWFQTAYGLTSDPFDVVVDWDFSADPDHADYTVKNTAGYYNIEMYAFYIQDIFWTLIQRGTVATNNSYVVN